MNTRTLFFTAVLIAALAPGAGLMLAQDDGGSADDPPVSAKEHSGFGRGFRGHDRDEGGHDRDEGRGAMMWRGRGSRGFGGRGMGMPAIGADMLALATEATGLEARELFGALRAGSSLASLIEAEGGEVTAFIAEATELVTTRMSANVTERIEALVNAEHPASGVGRDWRKPADKDEKTGGSAAAADAGEESGTIFTLDELFDEVRNGVRLVISYDAAANAFSGAIENTTDASIRQVRVEVHLANGVELGPTPTVSLAPGETREVRLDATDQDFEGWSAHAETGSAEHSGAGEGEHNGEEGEHGSEGSESAEG